ncbi:MAG TPA: YifB family Mg chelatase-like AAA ATPase [Longimicrobiales bacterium]|nr:YifB family Mg chelatase-like AAA ATPase [Longimicrobiales bacterium]
MLAQVTSGAVLGVDAYIVRVEVDLGRGLPCMNVVGLPENAVREGRERVTAALANAGYELPAGRITVNLAPADVPKSGSAFDLPVALGLLGAAGAFEASKLEGLCVVGELGLDGSVRPVRGVLPIADRCRGEGIRTLVCPPANAAEACVVDGLNVLPAPSLQAAIRHLQGRDPLSPQPPLGPTPATRRREPLDGMDFSDVKGQESAKRALEIAAAGGHNLLMIGPPGSGKSMLARRLPGILPPLAFAEALEVTRVCSVAGTLRPGQALVTNRPFRAPHHTVSDAGLVGGGSPPRPGEISMAHAGVLFLDELPEFRRNALEALRQPLEDSRVQIVRARVAITFPARFMLVAAMNPCPCGYHGTGSARCVCSPGLVDRYLRRISGPLLDRIDLHVHVTALTGDRLTADRTGDVSAAIRQRVLRARTLQDMRFEGTTDVSANAHMGPPELRRFAGTDPAGENLLRNAVHRLGLSARAYHRVLRVARTIADLGGAPDIRAADIAEAVQYRSLDRPRTQYA